MNDARPVAIFLPTLAGGGAERVFLTLADGFLRRGIAVDIVLSRAAGPLAQEIPRGARVVNLETGRVLTSLPRLMRYLRAVRPTALLTTMSHANVVGLWARRLARVPTRVIIREANTLAPSITGGNTRNRLMPLFVRRFYPWADELVAVSDGVAQGLMEITGMERARIRVLPNPIVTAELGRMAAEPLHDAWFAPGEPPVILGVGRLEKQKDFPTLIRAFAAVRSSRPVRLIILGEGGERPQLQSLLEELGVAADARLPGFVQNPFSYMARAAVFVLASAWEGMPGALIQAMACGVPVVATNCQSGPREVLAGGKFGRLVPVGDPTALATAITESLDCPPRPVPREVLAPYTEESAIEGYLRLLRIPAQHV
jgi:glycosyltransferase involved in cell wall biosynthesis